MGAGDTWEISGPSLQFCCEPKTALKKYFLKILKDQSEKDKTVLIENRSEKKIFLNKTHLPSTLACKLLEDNNHDCSAHSSISSPDHSWLREVQ